MPLEKVYLLMHSYVQDESDFEDHSKIVGIYSSRENAQLAIERMQSLPGFSDYPEGFSIDPYKLDEDHWTEGFN